MTDPAFAGRCKDCGNLHAIIVLSPYTADDVSQEVMAWRREGMTIEQMTVAEARDQLAIGCHRLDTGVAG